MILRPPHAAGPPGKSIPIRHDVPLLRWFKALRGPKERDGRELIGRIFARFRFQSREADLHNREPDRETL
jgi:hypothetical protein